ncbi:hypothetical protein CASFOL_019078 [Castilleja foliolosa]|uniref:Uncharacterized protein n=1 Tax=Castilleja foliolosa TaxID=1961234 RepID=A0ABD3D4M9_9LAMI
MLTYQVNHNFCISIHNLFQASVNFVAGGDGGKGIEKLLLAGFIADVDFVQLITIIIIVAAVEIHGRGT